MSVADKFMVIGWALLVAGYAALAPRRDALLIAISGAVFIGVAFWLA
jgi:uncharacterized membrane protein YGL010W